MFDLLGRAVWGFPSTSTCSTLEFERVPVQNQPSKTRGDGNLWSSTGKPTSPFLFLTMVGFLTSTSFPLFPSCELWCLCANKLSARVQKEGSRGFRCYWRYHLGIWLWTWGFYVECCDAKRVPFTRISSHGNPRFWYHRFRVIVDQHTTWAYLESSWGTNPMFKGSK